VPSERSPAALVVLVLVPLVAFVGLVALAGMVGIVGGGPWGFVPLLTTVLGLLIPLVALYLLARVVVELERIADALEARDRPPEE
jgi:uncharacterized membrane protein